MSPGGISNRELAATPNAADPWANALVREWFFGRLMLHTPERSDHYLSVPRLTGMLGKPSAQEHPIIIAQDIPRIR